MAQLHEVIIVTICILSLCNQSEAATNLYLRTEIDEENKKGAVIVDMADIFGLSWQERAEREFQLFGRQQLELSQEVVVLNENLSAVNQNTGIITLSRKVDRDALCGQDNVCTLKIQAMVRPLQYFQLLKLDVIIRDKNDNSPLFSNNVIAINVSENAKQNDIIDMNAFQARDIDSGNNSEIEYKLSSNQYFKVNQYSDETGRPQLKLILLKELDFESQSSHRFQLIASDKGVPPKSSHVMLHVTVLDENDNRPVFTSKNYVATVSESLSTGSEIVTVRANDLDTGANGHVTYKFIFDFLSVRNASMHELLSVDTATGIVRLQRRLSYQDHNGLKFRIEASDQGSPPLSSRTRLTLNVLDVNDHSPAIKHNIIIEHDDNAAYLLESSPPSTYVAYVSATDADYGQNNEVEIKIKTYSSHHKGMSEDSSQFVLAPDGLIQTSQTFDCEIENRYFIIIIACDKGDPSRCTDSNITVEILDVNDNSPAFPLSLYEVTISENADIGTDVIIITASDHDAQDASVKMKNEQGEIVPSTNGLIKYSIKDNDFVSIDPNSGKVVLVRPLDYEGNSKLEIIVIAADLGLPPRHATCRLRVNILDYNDNSPIFISPAVDNTTVYASILLDQPIIKLQAVDYDSSFFSNVSITLIEIDGLKSDDRIESNGHPLFNIFLLNDSSGELSLNLSYEKLYDIIGEHYVIAQASDNGIPALKSRTTLLVRVTDDLVLPKVITNQNRLPNTFSTDLPPLFLIIIIASAALAGLLIILAVVMVRKCKRKSKMDRSYSCREAENESGCTSQHLPLSSKEDCIQNGNLVRNGDVISRHQSVETRTKSLSLSSNQTSVNKDPLSPVTIAEPCANPEIYQLLPNHTSASSSAAKIVTSSPSSEFATQQRQCLLGERVMSSQADKDSGRGDSEVESSCWPGGQEKRTLSNYDTSNQANSLGKFCTRECTRYGHSDSCWMPETGETCGSTIHCSNNGLALEPIRENPTLCLKPVVGISCVPGPQRDRIRKSLCMALMGGEGHRHQPFRSEPSYSHYPSEDLCRLRQFWVSNAVKDDTSYSSVFGSATPSPAPSSGRCNSSSCDKEKANSSKECEGLLKPEHYLSLVSNHDYAINAGDKLRNSECL